jgi:hypothetical protein
MFKLYVVWPNGHGYTKDLGTMGAVIDELTEIGQNDEPATINITYLEEEVANYFPIGKVPFGTDQVGQSAVHGTKARD